MYGGGPAAAVPAESKKAGKARCASGIGIDPDQTPWRWLLLSNTTLGILGQQETDAA
jgi:hypothetical protein